MKYILLISLIAFSFSLETTTYEPSYENAKEIFEFFKAKGWTVNAISGMLGNMQYDSDGFQPNLDEMDEAEYGLVLWFPGTILGNWTKEKGLDYTTINAQCQRIQWELENNQRYVKNKCSYENLTEYSKSEEPAEKLAECFMEDYVHPREENKHLEDKQRSANYFFYRMTSDQPIIYTYQIKLENGTSSDLVYNDNKTYAGIIGEPIADLAIKTNTGKLTYQVYPITRTQFLPAVSKFDWSDYDYGYAGIGKRIDRVRIYFEGIEQPYYRVASINGEYSAWQYGRVIDESKGFKGYAGERGVLIDRLQIVACKPKKLTLNGNLEETNDELRCIYPDEEKPTDSYSGKLQFNSLLLFLLIIIFM